MVLKCLTTVNDESAIMEHHLNLCMHYIGFGELLCKEVIMVNSSFH